MKDFHALSVNSNFYFKKYHELISNSTSFCSLHNELSFQKDNELSFQKEDKQTFNKLSIDHPLVLKYCIKKWPTYTLLWEHGGNGYR